MNCFSSPFQPGKKGRQRSLGTVLLSRGGRLHAETQNEGYFPCCSQKLIEGASVWGCAAGPGLRWCLLCAPWERRRLLGSGRPPQSGAACRGFFQMFGFVEALWLGKAWLWLGRLWGEAVPLLP